MSRYSRRHLADSTLIANTESRLRHDRQTTADLLADLGEIDRRKLYLPAGYSSMYAWCLDRMSEDVTWKRIRAARAARRSPVIYDAVADGRLSLTAVFLLYKPLMKARDPQALLAEAMGKSKREILLLIAQIFPQSDLPTQVVPLAISSPAPGRVEQTESPVPEVMPMVVESPAPERVDATPPWTRVTPIAPARFGLQTTIDQETEDLLREAQELLGLVGSSHVPDVLKSAMRLYVEKLRKQKFGATDAPRPGRDRNPDSRHVPDEVQRAVWNRDGGRCAFVSESGHRCEERSGVQFDHILPYSLGGSATISNVRLLCPAHNQLEAERALGADFMRHKRKGRRRSA